MNTVSDTSMAYWAVHSCGSFVAATVDSPEHAKDVARLVGQWIRQGYRVERVTVAAVRAGSFCVCPKGGAK